MGKKNDEVKSDNSTLIQKYDAVNKAKSTKRTRNTYKQEILTLKRDEDYIDLLTKPKYRYATRSGENKKLKQKILIDFYKDSQQNMYLLQSNFSTRKPIIIGKNNLKEYPDMSVAMYVAINSKLRIENGSENEKIKTAELILLSRYDAYQNFEHFNKIDENTLKYTYFGESIKEKVPHFHFQSKTQALIYNDTAKCDAISLDNLIKYIIDLIKSKKDSELLFNDLSMPYLKVKYNPECYHTSGQILELANVISKKKLVQKSFIYNSVDKRDDLYGLKAVLFDLILLRGLIDGYENGPAGSKSGSLNGMQYVSFGGDFGGAMFFELMSLLAMKITMVGFSEELNEEICRYVQGLTSLEF